MSHYALGLQDHGDTTVHITKGLLKMTALCGHYPVNIITFGMDEEQKLCADCGKALDALPEDAEVRVWLAERGS